jgi:hypothetical protein
MAKEYPNFLSLAKKKSHEPFLFEIVVINREVQGLRHCATRASSSNCGTTRLGWGEAFTSTEGLTVEVRHNVASSVLLIHIHRMY